MNKKALTETDIRTKCITPALCGSGGAGWNLMTQIREEAYFTKGRVMVRGKTVQRGEAKKADYPFTSHGTPLEIVKLFGGRDGYLSAIRELETALYRKVA